MLKPHISTHLWTAKIMQSEAPTTLSAPADLSYELKFPLRRYFRKLWESHREYMTAQVGFMERGQRATSHCQQSSQGLVIPRSQHRHLNVSKGNPLEEVFPKTRA